MNSNSGLERQTFRLPLICRVCGDVARGLNFDVLTCISCKAFFRRHALQPLKDTRRCKHKSTCKITIKTRANCPDCRLKKCFVLGMNPKLIRVFNQQILITKTRLPTPPPLGLLQNDRSTLTSEQWKLISNIINVYNEENIVNNIKSLLTKESSLPARLRVKTSFPLEYISKCLSGVQKLIKHSTHFHSLDLNSRRELIHYNIVLAGCLNAAFVSVEVDLWSHEDFGIAYNTLLGADYFTQFSILPKRIDPNGILIKIMLIIMSFSSNYSIVAFNNQQNTKTKSNSLNLIHIQDQLATLLWKYLIYLYGFNEAVLRYSSLIKTLLDILYVLEEFSNTETYHQIFSMIITQTEQLLIVDD